MLFCPKQNKATPKVGKEAGQQEASASRFLFLADPTQSNVRVIVPPGPRDAKSVAVTNPLVS